MPGALLRSGTLNEFRALGVDGQPVYGAALQLRSAIRLKIGRTTANYLAIPQPNEIGDRVDWYAPTEGDVIPWSAATQEERDTALSQLESVHQQLLSAADGMEADANNREKQLFSRLLRKAIHFPSSEHVYLVDGQPVFTFWGFAQRDSAETDPLLCLQAPPSAPAIAAATPVMPPPMPAVTPVPIAPIKKRRWWWWLLWLLLLLLLLFLLLFGLRACAPQVVLPLGLGDLRLPGLPAPVLSEPDDRPDGQVHRIPRTHLGSDSVLAKGSAGGVAPWADDLTGGSNLHNPELAEALPDHVENTASENSQRLSDQESSFEQGQDEAPLSAPELSSDQQQPDDDALNQAPELVIPEDALEDGSTDFLNGHWHVGTGVQDTKTGQPLQLDYEFKNGQGQLRIQRDDGVECFAAVKPGIQNGGLHIRSLQQNAACNDGSGYHMPEVICKPGHDVSADCTGHYADESLGLESFDVTMRKKGG